MTNVGEFIRKPTVRPHSEAFMRFVRVMTVLAVAMVGACSGGDSGPAAAALEQQVVGHWSTSGDDNLYYGATDPNSKIGSFVMVHPDGKEFTHRYQIESVDVSERSIKINLLFASGDTREEIFVIAKDGNTIDKRTTITGMEIQSQLTRVDANTTP